MRLLSGNKIFQYPDEIDALLWKKFLRQNTSEQTNDSGRGLSKNGADEQSVLQNTVIHDGENEVLLVEWYGPEDPEVRQPPTAPIMSIHEMMQL